MAAAFVELILSISDIKNAIGSSKDMLIDAVAMTLAKSIDVAAGALTTIETCAAVVAGVVTMLTSQLVCTKKLPKGSKSWDPTLYGVRMLDEDEDGWKGGN